MEGQNNKTTKEAFDDFEMARLRLTFAIMDELPSFKKFCDFVVSRPFLHVGLNAHAFLFFVATLILTILDLK